VTLNVSGSRGAQYQLSVWNAAQIDDVAGAELKKKPEVSTLTLQIPGGGLIHTRKQKSLFTFPANKAKAAPLKLSECLALFAPERAGQLNSGGSNLV